ncbi:MAG: AraC family transcriptional regulator ligand-binding domain-containing protein [Myxococcales bacterium]
MPPAKGKGKQQPSRLYVSLHYLRGLVDYVRRQGGNVAPVLSALGAVETDLLDRDALVPHARQDEAFLAAALVLGDPDVGLHAGEELDVRAFGIVGELALTCRTAGDLLALQVRHQALIGNGLRSTRLPDPSRVILKFDLARSDVSRHTVEYTLAAQMTLARKLAGPNFRALRFEFPFAEPAITEEQCRVFGPNVTYRQAELRACFPAGLDEVVLGSVDCWQREILECAARERMASIDALFAPHDAELQRCQKHIAQNLSEGPPSVDRTAAALGQSVRTLQRRLELHGLTYRDLIDATRRRMASDLIATPNLSLVDVALLLGFSEQSAFNRAFRRWFGKTPRQVRAERRT